MSEEYIQYKNMTYEQKRAYHNQKNREYRERLAALKGKVINHHDPDSHPSLMTPDERQAYNRECLNRHKQRQQHGTKQPKLRAQRY